MSTHPLELIELARDGDLSHVERSRLEAHIAECASCRTYASELAHNDALLSRREAYVRPPELKTGERSPFGWTVVAAAAMLAAVVIATAIGISGDRAARPGVVAPTSATPTSAIPSASPNASSPAPAATPFVAEPSAIPGVRAEGLGPLRGKWIFVGKLVSNASRTAAELQVWAVPLEGGAMRRALAYDVSLGGAPEAILDNTPYLRRQFSPDGTRLVVSVGGQLVIVDLPTGQARRLGVNGYYPSWSKDGSRIAYVFDERVPNVATPERHIGVAPVDGGAARDLGAGNAAGEWSPDGSHLVVARQDGIAIVDVRSGREVKKLADQALGAPSSFAHWRSSSPQMAFTAHRDDGTAEVLVLDTAAANPRVLVNTGTPIAQLALSDPRWNPASSTELLYVAAIVAGADVRFSAHVVDAATGHDTTLPLNAYQATWTWDGRQIAYLVKASDQRYANALRLWNRDGSGEQVLMRADGNEYFFAVTALSY